MNGHANGELTALLNGVELTESQLKAGIEQIERKRKDAEPKRGVFVQGDVVVYAGDPGGENPPVARHRLVLARHGDRVDVLCEEYGYLHLSVPAWWYVKAPAGTEVKFTVKAK